jgi:hypothetical protein
MQAPHERVRAREWWQQQLRGGVCARVTVKMEMPTRHMCAHARVWWRR